VQAAIQGVGLVRSKRRAKEDKSNSDDGSTEGDGENEREDAWLKVGVQSDQQSISF
jgi:hypothetical protein